MVALNNCANTINVLHKDGRYLSVAGQSSSSSNSMNHDMPRPADLLAFEVFDCGLIGEGALHIVAAARTHLLCTPGARVLPGAAKVYCQPIQYNIWLAPALQGALDPTPLRSYAWQPDYFEVDLRRTQCLDPSSSSSSSSGNAHSSNNSSCIDAARPGPHWLPLAQPQLTFDFDFNCPEPLTAFQPAAQQLAFAVEAPGVCNAVAFWFELLLDEETCLSSSPYSSAQRPGQHTTWKQAVQLLPEHRVWPGQRLDLTASHDTYAISFTIPAAPAAPPLQPLSSGTPPRHTMYGSIANTASPPCSAAADDNEGNMLPGAPQPTGVPFVDPSWKAAYEAVSALQASLAKAATQDPLEYRRLVSAALLLAMRPWGVEKAPSATGDNNDSGQVAAAAAAPSEGRQDPAPVAEVAEACSRRGTAAEAQVHMAGAREAAATGSGIGSRQPAADPHHATALLVRLMS
ncbi:hypothetical protein COO60DRAFT_1623921 [Scenedesmus sp. NREL 46B-D3]|nr:hypothetical protein COO60DRAFT_1623921 [Scenedesmus sp. NREL 46B-D3]